MVRVLALSGSDLLRARWRDSNVAQSNRVKSIGFCRFDLIVVTASSRLSVGLDLHSASNANPKADSESPYITRSPAAATENPNSHITVSMGSAPSCGSAARTSFSYFAQFTAAKFSAAASLGGGHRSPANTSGPIHFNAADALKIPFSRA